MAGSAATESPRLDALMREAERRVRAERGRNLVIGLAFLAVIAVTYRQTEFNIPLLVQKAYNMQRLLVGFLHPDLAIVRPGEQGWPEGLIEHFALQTLAIAVLGTTIGALIAIPLSFVAARNLMARNRLGSGVYVLVRASMSVIRAVPTLFWGLLFVATIALGPFAGVLAVSLFSVGLMSKLFSEAIESIDWGQVEAATATGANPLQVVLHAVIPQVIPYMIAHLLYTFEVNVHSSTILGVIGAGGIGYLLIQYIEQFQYSSTATVLIVTILMTIAIDYFSGAVRRRIL